MAEHAMPSGIKREAKGVYVTLDGKVEIRQAEDGGWRLAGRGEPMRQLPLEPFKNRGLAVAWLEGQDLLPAEAPKPEQPKAEQPKADEAKPEAGKGRPTGRKPRAKAAASA